MNRLVAKHRKPVKLVRSRIFWGGVVSAGSLLGMTAPALAATVEVPELPGVTIDVPSAVVKAATDLSKKTSNTAINKAITANPHVKGILDQLQPKVGPKKAAAVKRVVPAVPAGTKVVSAARTRIGSPYVWGATGPQSFDCSGLVKWSYQQVGMQIPRTSQEQVSSGKAITKADLKPGDVVAFYSGASHVGVYSGEHKMIHASTEGVPVQEASIDSMPYYGAARYV